MSLALVILIAVLTGLLAGTLHVLSGPDHLAAIAPLTVDKHKKSWRIGLWWGIGHTTSFWFIALMVFLLKDFIPDSVSGHLGERIVGIVLVIVGVYGLQKVFQLQMHFHKSDSGRRLILHVHKKNTPHSHVGHGHSHKRNHGPVGIGIVHGFAGSGHLLAIIPALAIPGRFNAVAYVLGFGVGTVLAMMCFSWVIGMLQHRVIHKFSNGFGWMQAGFSCLAITIGLFWFITN